MAWCGVVWVEVELEPRLNPSPVCYVQHLDYISIALSLSLLPVVRPPSFSGGCRIPGIVCVVLCVVAGRRKKERKGCVALFGRM